MKAPGSPEELFGGTNPTNLNSDGLLATCYEGRFILQTFSTHDYFKEDIIAMWQNYIYYALKNQFLSR